MSSYGEALRERREVLGFDSAEAIADASYELEQKEPEKFKAFSRSTMNRLENDKTGGRIEGANTKMIRTLAYLLQWHQVAFEQHVGVPIGSVPYLNRDSKPMKPPPAPPRPTGRALGKQVELPHYGSVSAGVAGLTQGNDLGGSTTDYVEISADYLDGTDPDDCHLVEVTGDSMTCENVRRAIPEGATVIVNTAIQPVTGDVIVAELGLNGDRAAILKVYREKERGVVLDSYHMEHNRIYLAPDMEPRIVGVVVNFIPPGRRALRRMVSNCTVS